ncbi:endonuclease/exonuclease/phosphatase family protein [Kitasatospora griseola]|nr:endonuclease/exonuclease/phosphatase family protein [Kitasatospora griseola]
MNWNIEQLSINKLAVPGMLTAIAEIIVTARADIVLLLEVRLTQVESAMRQLSGALNGRDPGPTHMNWTGYFLSRQTGGEYYAALVRNLDYIRPVVVSTGPDGSRLHPLCDLRENTFAVWPTANWAATAYPVAAARPSIPLCDVFATPRFDRPAKRRRTAFAGKPLAEGGFATGRGYRLPALAMFWVRTAVPGGHLLPFVICHYAAVRGHGQRNTLAQAQVAQLPHLHIAQLFNSNPAGPGTSGYLDVLDDARNHRAVRVQELCFTGDFNIDFLHNSAAGDHLARVNRAAIAALTPTAERGGSAAPPAAPGVAGPVPPVPYAPPQPPAREIGTIGNQVLRAAVTEQGTIQREYPLPVPPPPPPYASAAFDNFFYGGTCLVSAAQHPHDAGEVINVPVRITQAHPAPPGQINLAATAGYYVIQLHKKNADNAPGLRLGAPPLTDNERLIGARLISDHLPVVLEFNCP